MKLKLYATLTCFVALATTIGCSGGKLAHNLPPAQRLMEPGPGVGGPGPGVISPNGGMPMGSSAMSAMMNGGGMGGPGGPGGGMCPPMSGGPGMGMPGMGMPGGPGMGGPAMGGPGMDGNVMQAQCLSGPGNGMCGPGGTSQLAFLGVEGGEVTWDVSGQCMFDSAPLVMPGRQNFYQGGLYRLKLSNLPERPGVELYPTVEVAPVTPRTDAYLAHAPIPIQFTDEDLDQVLSGNFVTKVIYLPDPEFQELALAGVETLVSTRLDPGVDPIAEADRRGSILAIVRIGNLDLRAARQSMASNPGVRPAEYYEGEGGYEADMGYGCPDGGCQPGYSDGGMSMGSPGMGGMGQQGMGGPASAGVSYPPHLIAGVNVPQYGMPHVGTPIGLPGPPHIPLGHVAGLKSHTMKNRTKVLMPPPVHDMKISVKQRPGMSYPRPVNHVKIDETNRAGLRLFGGTVAPAVPTALHKLGARLKGACKGDECEGCEVCQ